MKVVLKLLIKFYQKYLSIFSHGSCRYYPTCSNYAIWQLENNSFFKAFYHTITRILKCNQFFKGGIDYPIIKLKNINNIEYKKIKIKYWYIPLKTKDKMYYVVKNREWKNCNE